jgi:cytochrome c-type biogenesis protein CcmH/NrfF
MIGRRGSLLAAAALLSALLALPSAIAIAKGPTKDPARQITDEIICPCSCGEILTGCTCDTAKSMRAYIDAQLKGGRTKSQIEAALVAKYGEVVLGAPKPKGFNMVVWVAPFVATLAGFAIAALVLKRWVGRRALPVSAAGGGPAGSGAPGTAPSAEESMAALRARAEAELERLRE